MSEKKMSGAVEIKTLILMLIVSILLTSLHSIPLVNAQPIPTTLTIAVLSPPTEEECTITATLKDENDDPLPNMDVDFYVCDSDKIGSNKTNSAGVASLKLTDNPDSYYPRLDLFETKIAETWKISARFRGTTNYARSKSEDAYIAFVFIDYTPYIVGGALTAVAIIGVVAYILHRQKKGIRARVTPNPNEHSLLRNLSYTYTLTQWGHILVSIRLSPLLGFLFV